MAEGGMPPCGGVDQESVGLQPATRATISDGSLQRGAISAEVSRELSLSRLVDNIEPGEIREDAPEGGLPDAIPTAMDVFVCSVEGWTHAVARLDQVMNRLNEIGGRFEGAVNGLTGAVTALVKTTDTTTRLSGLEMLQGMPGGSKSILAFFPFGGDFSVP